MVILPSLLCFASKRVKDAVSHAVQWEVQQIRVVGQDFLKPVCVDLKYSSSCFQLRLAQLTRQLRQY